jgi:hypothetical protein
MACLSDSVVATFVQGHATADELAAVEAHVAECPECRALVAQLAELAPAPDRDRTLLDTDDDEATQPLAPPAPPRWPVAAQAERLYRWRWPLAAALVLAAIAAGVAAGRRHVRDELADALAEARVALAAGDGARARAAASTPSWRARWRSRSAATSRGRARRCRRCSRARPSSACPSDGSSRPTIWRRCRDTRRAPRAEPHVIASGRLLFERIFAISSCIRDSGSRDELSELRAARPVQSSATEIDILRQNSGSARQSVTKRANDFIFRIR